MAAVGHLENSFSMVWPILSCNISFFLVFGVSDFKCYISLTIGPSFDLQIQDGRRFKAHGSSIVSFQVCSLLFVIGSNESSLRAELSDRY